MSNTLNDHGLHVFANLAIPSATGYLPVKRDSLATIDIIGNARFRHVVLERYSFRFDTTSTNVVPPSQFMFMDVRVNGQTVLRPRVAMIDGQGVTAACAAVPITSSATLTPATTLQEPLEVVHLATQMECRQIQVGFFMGSDVSLGSSTVALKSAQLWLHFIE